MIAENALLAEMGELVKIGMIGLGKLGLPCLLAMERYGNFEIVGFDNSARVLEAIQSRQVHYWEEGVNELLAESQVRLADSIHELVQEVDVIFVAVPTPHDAQFEGATPTPDERRNFDYSAISAVTDEICESLESDSSHNPLVVVISTCLPGTMNDLVLPRLREVRAEPNFCYNPYFIAMGTTIRDFLNPEFCLIGSSRDEVGEQLASIYHFLDAPKVVMSIESAELTKVAYNTFIGMKITFANALAEITSSLGGDVDEVTSCLALAGKRLMSGAYLSAGMADGGGCHPRDQIAMSWLAREIGMSADIFGQVAEVRDLQTARQARDLANIAVEANLPVTILGWSYKENSPLDVGSPSRLLAHYLVADQGIEPRIFDPWFEEYSEAPREASVCFLAVRHEEFRNVQLPPGSILIDPWGFAETSSHDEWIVTRPGRRAVRNVR